MQTVRPNPARTVQPALESGFVGRRSFGGSSVRSSGLVFLALLLSLSIAPRSEGAVGGTGGSGTTFTSSVSTTKVYHSTWVTQRADVARTRITATGPSGAEVYDQTFDLPFSDSTVQAAVTAARQAIVAAAAPGQPTIAGPTLQSHTVFLADRQSVTQETGRSPASNTTVNSIVGPAVICAGIAGKAGQPVPPSCDPLATPLWITAGGMDIDTNTVSQVDVTQTITVTDTYRTAEEYLLSSTVAGAEVAQVPTLSESGLLALGVALAGLGLSRLRSGGAACLLLALLAGTAAGRATAQTITLASRAVPGFAWDTAGGTSAPLGTSADGCTTLFQSVATNLVPGQVNRNVGSNLFLHDRTAGTVVLVSHAAGSPATTANQATSSGILSADGRYVAFLSNATDVVPGFVNASAPCYYTDGVGSSLQLYLFDRVSGGIVLVSHRAGSATTSASECPSSPVISDDGRFVAFQSTANDLVAGQSGVVGGTAVYLFDRDNPDSTRLVSHQAGSPLALGTLPAPVFPVTWAHGTAPSISGDGAYVSYYSDALDLVSGQVGRSGVFLWDRATGSNVVVSRVPGAASQVASDLLRATSGTAGLFVSALSADGQYVAFPSGAPGLVTGQVDANGVADLFLFDRVLGTNALVSHAAGSAVTAASCSKVESDARYGFSVASDGSWVAFASQGTGLVQGATGSGNLLYLWDRATRNIQLASLQAGSTTAGRAVTTGPVISGDGRRVGFTSMAVDLVASQVDSGNIDAFLFDRTAGATALVSHRAGAPATARSGGHSSGVSISRDGSRVVFGSPDTDLVAGITDANAWADVFSYDTASGTNSLVSRREATLPSATEGVESYSYHQPPSSLSADGRYVVFTSTAAHLVSGQVDTNGSLDVFLFDKATLATTLVSRRAGTATTAGNGASDRPVISADGRRVAFRSTATDLVSGQVEPNVAANVFLFDRSTGSTLLVSHYAGVPARAGNRDSDLPVISADGRFVAYVSLSGNLVAGQAEGSLSPQDVFLYDRTTGASTLVSNASASAVTAGSSTSFDASISADGRYVAFTSRAADLVAGQSNPFGSLAVFLYDRTTGGNELVSRSTSGPLVRADLDSFHPVVSADGKTVAFSSLADDLDPLVLDANRLRDVYLYTKP